MSFGVPFSYPFYAGESISSLVPSRFHIGIAGHGYMIDWTQYQRDTLEMQRAQFDQGDEPGEGTFNPEGYWPRTQSVFDHGAGQRDFDEEVSPRRIFADEEGSNRRRFLSSVGVNPFDGDAALELLFDTEEKHDTSNTNLKTLYVGGYLYILDGSTLKRTADPTASTPTFTDISLAGAGTDITTDGTTLWIAEGTLVESVAVGLNTASTFSTVDVDILEYVNGRLVCGHDHEIFELDNAGALVGSGIWTPDFNTAGDWVAICGTPVGIFAAYTANEISTFYSIEPDDVDTALGVPVYAGRLPDGEQAYALTEYGNILAIGTSRGVRVAEFGTNNVSNNVLQIGQTIEISNGVRCFEGQGRFVWFGWSDYDGSKTGLGRLDLSRSIRRDSIVPVYASDLMAAEQGTVTSVASFGDKRFFCVSGAGVYGETDDRVASGELYSGFIRHGTFERKVFSGVTIGHDPLAGSITAYLVDDGTEVALGVSDIANTTSSDLFDASETARRIQLKLVLTRDSSDTTLGPGIRFWILNALPAPPRVDEIIVPIILKRAVVDLNGQEYNQDPLTEFLFLKEIENQGRVVRYQEGANSEQVRISRVVIDRAVTGMSTIEFDREWLEINPLKVRLLTKETN